MKKFVTWSLCLTLLLGTLASSAQAAGLSFQDGKQVLEDSRRRPPPPPRGGRRPPPPPRGHRPPPPPRYHGSRHHSGGSGWVGFGIGAAIGTAIGAAVANTAPAPEPVMVYDPACNCYYYQ